MEHWVGGKTEERLINYLPSKSHFFFETCVYYFGHEILININVIYYLYVIKHRNTKKKILLDT